MVRVLNVSLLGASALMAYSSYTGENQLDTSVSMYSHRSWCAAAVSLFPQKRRAESLYPTRR